MLSRLALALLAGFAIFPLVFAHGMAPDSGEGLVFQTLPIVFGDLPGGRLFAALAGTTAVSLVVYNRWMTRQDRRADVA